MKPRTFLLENDWTTKLDSYQNCSNEKHRRKHDQSKERTNNIEQSLEVLPIHVT